MNTHTPSFPCRRSLALVLPALLAATAGAQQRPTFLTPTQMPAPVNLAGSASYSMALSADGLRAIVESDRAGGPGGRDVFLLQRPDVASSFTSYGPMGLCTPADERTGMALFPLVVFSSDRPGGTGGQDLYAAIGPNVQPWPSQNELNSPFDDTDPAITSDGLELFFTSNRPGSLGGRSIWHSTRATTAASWSPPVVLAGIDSANHEQSPTLTDDGLWLFFSSDRGGDFDVLVAGRASRQAPFGAPVHVAELSGPNPDMGIELAPGGTAILTVLVNQRAVLLAAERRVGPPGPATELTASAAAAPGDVLSVTLRSPAGDLGVIALGAPMTPVATPLGQLALLPGSLVVFDVGVQGPAGVRLVQLVLPANPLLSGLPFGLQAVSGPLAGLALTDAVLLVLQ